MAPTSVVKTAADEKKWSQAKAEAHKADPKKFYAYVMAIYKRKKGGHLGRALVNRRK